MIRAEIDPKDERDRLTREGMADVKAGRVVDSQVVQAWAESLDSGNPLPVTPTKKGGT